MFDLSGPVEALTQARQAGWQMFESAGKIKERKEANVIYVGPLNNSWPQEELCT